MKEFTQSNIDPGNCWQTAVACILEVDPDLLPPQHEIEALDAKILGGWGSYHNVLNAYLAKHHGLIYFEVYEYMFGGILPVNPYVVMVGPTVRTAEHVKMGRRHIQHAVVGFENVQVWDPHPSRAGLLHIERWGVLGVEQKVSIDNRRKRCDDVFYMKVFNCLCPQCGLHEVRKEAEEFERKKVKIDPKDHP